MQCSARPRVPPLDLSGTHALSRADLPDFSTSDDCNSETRTNPWGGKRDREVGPDKLPIDPRNWTRSDVSKWLELTSKQAKIPTSCSEESKSMLPSLGQRFPMNGKALCLMSRDMYLCRVPRGGEVLYHDFRQRLYRAIYRR